MYARVAKWEGAEAEALRTMAQEIKSESASGPPEGVPMKGFLMLIDPDGGRCLGVTLFETEADMRTGDEVLNTMSPGGSGMGKRTGVEMYEVALDITL